MGRMVGGGTEKRTMWKEKKEQNRGKREVPRRGETCEKGLREGSEKDSYEKEKNGEEKREKKKCL